eukprot:TRINITY_DN17121_c0_g1_i1.p1 TRINITY_DN17121_c0_g1~~TRINITY_DN17121_c0_g1_i1.p1  ORF type:complete len:246 (-),score=43.23 TRINITY_DN17121_c0_g1_i1:148-885(-)
MGSCVSVHKNPNSAMKIRISVGSKAKKLFIPSPAKEKPSDGNTQIAEIDSHINFKQSQSWATIPSRHFGSSKEEIFFDSQAWLDSDCEDDYLSVNGDFTPSGSSTPTYQSGTLGMPQLNKAHFLDRIPAVSKPEPSPTDNKKKLADLLQESLGGEQDFVDRNIVTENLEINKTDLHPPKSSDGTPYMSRVNSICSSEKTPNKDPKEKNVKAPQCCLPGLVQSLSFSERKKRLSPSPGHQNGMLRP